MNNANDIKLSVIMTVYNCATTIAEALDSIITQSYNNFQLIICDDGSTDGTYQILESYKENHHQIILIRNKTNKGRAYSSNRCIGLAKGQYTARMDGDDLSLPRRFEFQLHFLDTHPEFDFVSSAMIYFDHKGDYRKSNPIAIPQISDFTTDAPFCHGPSMIRTSILKSIGGYNEDKSLERLEDFDLWYRLYLNNYRGYNMSNPLYKMRNDKAAFSRRKHKYRWLQFKYSLKMRKALMVPNRIYYSLIDLLKVFVPWQILYWTRRIR